MNAVIQIAGEPPRQHAQTLAELRAAGRKALEADPALLANRGEPGPGSLFTIVYTSGTTARPRASF